MITSLSSNVILAKVRAKYGKILNQSDYKALLECKSVQDVAGYLKNNTVYQNNLSGIDESIIHRRQLEMSIHQKMYEETTNLCKYELGDVKYFVDYLLFRNGVEVIINTLTTITFGTYEIPTIPKEMLYSISRHTRLNIDDLKTAKTFDDVLDILKNTEYADILKPFRPEDGETINLSKIENELYNVCYNKAFYIIEKYSKGYSKKELYKLFNSIINLKNYVRVIRLKKYYNCSPDYIKSMMLPTDKNFEKYLEKMAHAENLEDVNSIFKTTSLGKSVKDIDVQINDIDELVTRYQFKLCKNNIYFTTNAAVILMSYLFLLEIEYSNLNHIIEGIRYNMDKKEIEKLIIN